jgi:hypothetical protein
LGGLLNRKESMSNIFYVHGVRSRYKGFLKTPFGKRHISESLDGRFIFHMKRRPTKRALDGAKAPRKSKRLAGSPRK